MHSVIRLLPPNRTVYCCVCSSRVMLSMFVFSFHYVALLFSIILTLTLSQCNVYPFLLLPSDVKPKIFFLTQLGINCWIFYIDTVVVQYWNISYRLAKNFYYIFIVWFRYKISRICLAICFLSQKKIAEPEATTQCETIEYYCHNLNWYIIQLNLSKFNEFNII